jgi:molybdopterin-guanine dinucleotide biosynthesis protein A
MSRPFGVILAGGRSTRMGGGDKALAPLGGRRLIDFAVERLGPQTGRLAISANGDPARFADYGLPVLPDGLADHPGPLAGVLAGLDWAAKSGADAIVTAAADTPFFPRDLAARLAAAGAPVALAATPGADGRPARHPTFALWPVALRDDLRAALASGARKVSDYADRHGAATALFAAEPFDPFFDVDTPGDLAEAQALLAQGAAA